MISPRRQSFIHAAWVIRSVVRSMFIWLSSNCRYIIVTTAISRSEIASRARDNWKKIKVATQRMRHFFSAQVRSASLRRRDYIGPDFCIATGSLYLVRTNDFIDRFDGEFLLDSYEATLISVINCCTPDRTVQLFYERQMTCHSTWCNVQSKCQNV